MRSARPRSAAIAALAERLKPVFQAHPEIAVAYLFGSVARGTAGPESDLDLGMVFRERGGQTGDPDLMSVLAYEVGRLVDHREIDLVVLEEQGPIFCHRVLCDGACIYEGSRDRRVDFESETMVRAFDFRPTYELATRGKVEALRRWLKKAS